MAHQDRLNYSSRKDKEILTNEANGRDQTQCSALEDSWLIQVKSILNSPHQIGRVSKNVCIYKVPEVIKISKQEAYVPLCVSFGPNHYKNNHESSRMNKHKLVAVHRILTRLQVDLTRLIEEVRRLVLRDLLTNSSVELAAPIDHDGYGVADNMSNYSFSTTSSPELLHKANIKFQTGQLGFQNRKFGASKLSLPRITVDDSIETKLRNLMAYEDCHLISDEAIISHYVYLFRGSIESEKDVSVLRKSQVVASFLGSDKEIARRLKNICAVITSGSNPKIELVMTEVREHYKSQCKVQPLYVLIVVVVILFLVMTALKTVYSVKK
ncbi:hypothetical protein SUGI_0694180 [Cryptomeria japonica]|nr:hypothetical protein SUGI_0694180 [Cryptomeria japonica]